MITCPKYRVICMQGCETPCMVHPINEAADDVPQQEQTLLTSLEHKVSAITDRVSVSTNLDDEHSITLKIPL